ncbi:MAG TPA: NRDE family protein [Woeseiaceae bacterium]
MCLIAFAWNAHPEYRLILAANRDEFHGRPSEAMHWWQDREDLLAGRDLEAGGTWLGVSRSGRFAAVTNYREELQRPHSGRSRGELVVGFLQDEQTALAFCTSIDLGPYRGVSMLAAAGDEMAYVSNRGDAARSLAPGIYGLSNASLDTPWTKVARSKAALRLATQQESFDTEFLFRLLADREPAATDDYAGAGLPPELARAVSAPFIASTDYGTRCSTALLVGRSGCIQMYERRFDNAGRPAGETSFEFHMG